MLTWKQFWLDAKFSDFAQFPAQCYWAGGIMDEQVLEDDVVSVENFFT